MKNQKKRITRRKGTKGKEHESLLKLNAKDNVDLTNTPHEEEYTDENYKSVEEWKPVYKCIKYIYIAPYLYVKFL